MKRNASPSRAARAAALSALVTFSMLGALELAGCASLPPPTPARQAKAPTAYATEAAFSSPVADWPADGWWKRYGDTQLNALMDEALAGQSPSSSCRSATRTTVK